jgi:hypothetical protein
MTREEIVNWLWLLKFSFRRKVVLHGGSNPPLLNSESALGSRGWPPDREPIVGSDL